MTEQLHNRPKTLSKRAGRTVVIVFFLLIALMTGVLTRGLGPLIAHIKHDAASELHFYKVTEVIAGDTLRVESNRTRSKRRPKKTDEFPWVSMEIVEPGSNEVIRVAGIMTPPLPNSPETSIFMEKTGVPQEALPHLSDVARKALVILLHKQLVDLEFTGETRDWNGQPVRLAQVKKSGVDVAFKQITGCQAMVTDDAIKYRDEYLALEAKAREEGYAIWKYLPSP